MSLCLFSLRDAVRHMRRYVRFYTGILVGLFLLVWLFELLSGFISDAREVYPLDAPEGSQLLQLSEGQAYVLRFPVLSEELTDFLLLADVPASASGLLSIDVESDDVARATFLLSELHARPILQLDLTELKPTRNSLLTVTLRVEGDAPLFSLPLQSGVDLFETSIFRSTFSNSDTFFDIPYYRPVYADIGEISSDYSLDIVDEVRRLVVSTTVDKPDAVVKGFYLGLTFFLFLPFVLFGSMLHYLSGLVSGSEFGQNMAYIVLFLLAVFVLF